MADTPIKVLCSHHQIHILMLVEIGQGVTVLSNSVNGESKSWYRKSSFVLFCFFNLCFFEMLAFSLLLKTENRYDGMFSCIVDQVKPY